MMRHRVRLCLVGVLLSTAPAAAQTAAELLNKGQDLYGLADFEGSLSVLDRALRATTNDRLLGLIHMYRGLNDGELERMDQARAAFTLALGHDPDACPDAARFKSHLVNLCQQVRRSMTGTLVVTASRAGTPGSGARREGARVMLDDSPVGRTPFRDTVPIGSHRVLVQQPDGTWVRNKTTVRANRETLVQVQLTPAPAVAPPAEPTPARRRLWTWVAAGGAAAAVIAATSVWIAADRDYDTWNETPDTDGDRLDELERAVKRKEIAAWTLFGLAGAAAVTSAVLFFLEGRPAERRAARSGSLVVGPTGAMLRVDF